MSYRLVTITKKSTLALGESIELSFRPGVAKNISATAELSDNTYVELVLLDDTGKVLERDTLSYAPLVNHQPKEVGNFRARVTNRSSVPVAVVLVVNYYSDEKLTKEPVPIAKIVEAARRVLDYELKPSASVQGKHLKVTGDASLLSMLGKWADRELDIGVSIDGLQVDSSCFEIGFDPPDDAAGYPFGSVFLRIKCPQSVTISKYWIGKVRIPEPVFTLRAGFNVYGGAIHLAPVVFQLPQLDPNWAATLGEWVKGVVSDATADLTSSLARAIADLEQSGKLVEYTRKVEKVLSMQRLHDLRIVGSNIELEFEPRPAEYQSPAAISAPAPKSSRIEHLVIVMLENRSFDHMMADIVAGRTDVTIAPGVYSETVIDTAGNAREYRRGKSSLHALPHDPPHDSENQDRQANGEFVKTFLDDNKGSPYGAEVLSYQPREHVPFFDFLTREFVICDNWRAALRGHTWPNRQYSLAGASRKTSKGYRDNPSGNEIEFYTLPTICDVLEAQGVDWAYYKDDFAFLELYRRWVFDQSRIRTRKQFDDAIRTGQLPTVCWFEPNISDFGRSLGNDDHPPMSVYSGQRLLAKLYKALCSLPTDNWMLAITYDESGGFYDHVPPEDAPDDQPGAVKQGFRVPAFLVSPWLKAGKVCKEKFDHASLIRTVLDNFCAPEPIFQANTRVRTAPSFAGIADVGSELATDAPRAMPKFTEVIPAVGSLDVAGSAVAEIQPQKAEFAAFEAAKQALLTDQAKRRVPELTLEVAGVGDVPPTPVVRFEGLYVRPRVLPPELATLGWTTRPWFDDAFEARPPAPISAEVAWDVIHDLRARLEERGEKIVIDPLWETTFPEVEPEAKSDLQVAGAPDNRRWHLDAVKAPGAWKVSPNRGEGIVIGHLDTGYLPHPDLDPMLLASYGWDVYRDDDDPHDDMERGFLKFPGHGTSTVSIIGSRGVRSDVIGTAPGVSVIPIRISASVVHLSMSNMVRGIQMAVERNVHVISLSAGGLWSAALHRAVREAVDAGVIVVAAAGNYTEIVVWPARFEEVIACGAINERGGTWLWSNGDRGEHVTVMAPGEDVWVLRAKSKTEIIVSPGSGTSFATACVAGAVATWLAHRGRDKLIEKYGRANLARVAKSLIQTTSVDRKVLDMTALLEATLPATVPAPLAPLASVDDALAVAGPDASFREESVFWDTVDRLSKRASGSAAPTTAPPIEALGAVRVAPRPPPKKPRMSARLEVSKKRSK